MEEQPLIFVVEDDESIRELLRCALGSYQYRVACFESADDMLSCLPQQQPDLILLDVMLPGTDGISALRYLRGQPFGRSVPVILLTARDREVDKVTGLDSGADDYITKPFGLLELSARVRAALRRRTPEEGRPQWLQAGRLRLCPESREARLGDAPLELTNKEFALLCYLMRARGRVVPREELLRQVWGYGYVGETRTLDIHIKTLRQKLGDDAEQPTYIKTVRSVGYKLLENGEGAGA